MFESIGLISKPGDEKVADTLERLVAFLEGRAVRFVLDRTSAAYLPRSREFVATREELGNRCDLAIVIGETVLFSAPRARWPDARSPCSASTWVASGFSPTSCRTRSSGGSAKFSMEASTRNDA